MQCNASISEDGTNECNKTSKRKKNYCLYCEKLVAKFSEHVEKKHFNTPEGAQLKNITEPDGRKRRAQKTKITDGIRKQWNSVYNKEMSSEESVILVKRRHGKESKSIPNVQCKHCMGLYRRDKLRIHLKTCSTFYSSHITESNNKKQCTSAIKHHSQPFLPQAIIDSITPQFKNEILLGIQTDSVMKVALHDPLIMKFGSEFHLSRREASGKSYVIREVRDMARLLIKMKNLNPRILTMKDCLNPTNFDILVEAALSLAEYNCDTGNVNVPSIAYRLTQPLKDAANILKSEELAKVYANTADRKAIDMVDDFLNMINTQWKSKIGRLCTKARKRNRADINEKMTLEEDIIKMSTYIENSYREELTNLEYQPNKNRTYDLITHMLVVHVMLLIRRRPVDFKHAKVRHYNNIDKHDELIDMVKGHELTKEDLAQCKKFHLFYVPGKNLELVPIVMTPQMKNVMDCLLNHRKSVGISEACDNLFVKSNEILIKPTESIKFMKRRVSLTKPDHFTGNGLRHQAATFSKLHSTHPLYQDYLASALGHTLTVHKKHYDLPTGILQKLMVCPILHDIMTGKARKNKKRNNAFSEEESPETSQETLSIAGKEGVEKPSTTVEPGTSLMKHAQHENEDNSREDAYHLETRFISNCQTPTKRMRLDTTSSEDEVETTIASKKPKRRWSDIEQEVVLLHFGKNIMNKIMPKRGEVALFLNSNQHILSNRSIAQVLLFIRNHVFRQQKNVSPKITKIMEKHKKST